ncbi:MAG: VOC family protein [Proteobacteria bacterium]|uniref:VOC family protein n=1 Tax=Brevundimonas sp. TaxID=1871086 RepID=UPI001AD43F36|nr:VOC family protein [Brevundimonas sp.]MBN9464536.1 VOC family protein [Brevundimonas sp.]MCA0368359.1 VOC family protein [Pseudomonadota bacterium]
MTDARPDQGPTCGVTPHLTIPSRGASAAVDFYIIAFGAEVLDRRLADDGERLMHAHLRINGASVMLNDEFPEYSGVQDVRPAGVTLHLQVADPDAWWTRALVVGGAEPVMDMADQFWGDRYGILRDPFGHTWSIGGPKPA